MIARGERETENGRRDEGESKGGLQALARHVMIDWLAGSQQTDIRPPDQFTPMLTHPFFLIRPPRILLRSLSYFLLVSFALSLGTTFTATDTKTISPGAQACSKSS